MPAPVFVDTNVLLYARDAGDAAKQRRAAGWLEYLWREQLGRTSIQVLSEYYVNVTRKLTPGLSQEDAWDDVQSLMTWSPHPMDEPLLERGRDIERRYELSWWDSLIIAAAQLQGCPLLLTEDLQDGGVYGSVKVRSPFTLDLGEPAAAYTTVARAVSRHPARGRPKLAVR